MRSIGALLVCFLLAAALAGCHLLRPTSQKKYTDTFFDTFDTFVTVVAYTRTEKEFDDYFQRIHQRFLEFHKLYDIYNAYPGINNLKTINDNAGVNPVNVDKEIIDLIVFAKDWHKKTGGQTNIAMGSVLRIWHDYREQGMEDPQSAQLPPMEALRKAAEHTDIDKVIVDIGKSTVFLADKDMSLDVGAVAKGYATAVVTREMRAQGLESAFISSSGNIETVGKPLDGVRERWGIGVQDPEQSVFSNEQDLLDVIYANNVGVASSGDYQRYYVVDGKPFHHLIDPKTLMPGDYYRAVTIKAPDAGIADFMSTAAFLLPLEESKVLVESLEGVEAIWVTADGRVEATDGMKTILRSNGATGAKAE